MELMQAIKERRSIRRFTDQPISDQDLETLLEAIRWTPSWANTQVWEVILVRDQNLKEQLSPLLGKNPASKAVIEAPVVFVLAAKLKTSGYYKGEVRTNKGDWFMFDLGLATQNLCLAAHALGLGSVIVGLFDAPEAEKLLGVPEGYAIGAIIPVGHPAQEVKAPKRREVAEFTHNDRF